MLIRAGAILAMLMLFGGIAVSEQRTPAPKDAQVYIIWPPDGAVIKGGKLWVRMGIRNAGVAPKGVDMANVGHHHLLINTDLPPFDQEIPSDRNHIHFGGGQTEARLEDLPPGKHTLEFDFKYDGLGAETLKYGSPSGLGRSGTGYLKVDGKVVATKKMEKTVPMLMQ